MQDTFFICHSAVIINAAGAEGKQLRPWQETKQWCLVRVDFVTKHRGLLRGTTEVPL